MFEEAGLCTTLIALVKEHAARVKPPRALAVPFPYGFALGKTNDPQFQHKVLAAAFDLLKHPNSPVLAEFPEDGQGPVELLQASAVQALARASTSDPAAEVTALRPYYERWVEERDGRTLVGLSGVPQRQFRGIIRFLEGYVRGEEQDSADRPADVDLPLFIRWCVDDLKAFYYEARMNQRPDDDEEALHRWFWGESAMGKLIAELGQKMDASEDRVVKATAFGLAR